MKSKSFKVRNLHGVWRLGGIKNGVKTNKHCYKSWLTESMNFYLIQGDWRAYFYVIQSDQRAEIVFSNTYDDLAANWNAISRFEDKNGFSRWSKSDCHRDPRRGQSIRAKNFRE